MRGYIKAGCAVAALALLSGCGTTHVGASATKKASPPICPQAAVNVSAPPCVSVGVDQDQQSNEMYNERAPMPSPRSAHSAM